MHHFNGSALILVFIVVAVFVALLSNGNSAS